MSDKTNTTTRRILRIELKEEYLKAGVDKSYENWLADLVIDERLRAGGIPLIYTTKIPEITGENHKALSWLLEDERNVYGNAGNSLAIVELTNTMNSIIKHINTKS